MNELLMARVGFDLSAGTGWIVPVIKRADWPLGRLVVTDQGITSKPYSCVIPCLPGPK
jgi:hypothetical protein